MDDLLESEEINGNTDNESSETEQKNFLQNYFIVRDIEIILARLNFSERNLSGEHIFNPYILKQKSQVVIEI
ncbi:hypothetical protein BCR32DRAFT_280655 [Anaeromyces robustus]|uniref:Uncharacterized protein n=1 Tax=Anaeromyces robustus TaxID=1754192 RepID=A0A1Y1X3N6_9FUNG|nr:hypothetical protein BCR32DRAFT_280655 [Anaeromyces robustus]|eukprot:ORX80312.1 hypothetical protein BCR32DRAFT_280655 [Anaeromyces robustus]